MKELDKLIKAMNDKGTIDSLKRAVSRFPVPEEAGENKQEWVNEAVKHCLCTYFNDHDEMHDLFCEFAFELGLDTLVKKLDIKPSDKTAKDFPDLLHKLIDDLFKK